MPKKIILIRHGETEYNRLGKWHGWVDVPLNAAGKLQAKKLARRLKGEVINALFTSDLKRAVQTTHTIAKSLGIKPIKTTKLRERAMGLLEGRHKEEKDVRIKKIWENFFNDTDETYKGHGGESIRETKARLHAFLNNLNKKYKQKIVAIVTHGGTQWYLLQLLIKKPLKEGTAFQNAGVTVLEKDRWGEYHIAVLSDTSHLEEK